MIKHKLSPIPWYRRSDNAFAFANFGMHDCYRLKMGLMRNRASLHQSDEF